ncbi:hypothetical protein E4U17_001646 [Claviceps sp. LM77 group G4]|nr:hypothetical protein E4U17_001646 [Claviceps sp. LM77 group G4]KAG6047726.1 hypothetical protein E4U33_001026 [Claviceps sp. LM78 group G4]KAG6064138.1 hypothetical protein E4U16_000745 [Claviceps sp. LM84 group G4]
MSADHLSPDEFLDKLVQLFDRKKGADHGAVYLTQKRFSFSNDVSVNDKADSLTLEDAGGPMSLIIRATNGKSKKERSLKIKISTIVHPNDVDDFYIRYADICKLGMVALKPRDRSKKKARAKRKKTV